MACERSSLMVVFHHRTYHQVYQLLDLEVALVHLNIEDKNRIRKNTNFQNTPGIQDIDWHIYKGS